MEGHTSNIGARKIVAGLEEAIAATTNPYNRECLQRCIEEIKRHLSLRLTDDERSELEAMIRRLEARIGMPLEISVGYNDGKEEVYGAFYDRPFEVVALPTNDDSVQKDLDVLKGNYKSLKELEQKIKGMSLHELWGKAVELLGKKFGTEEVTVIIKNMSRDVPDKEAKRVVPKGMKNICFTSLEMLEEENPSVYRELLAVLDENSIPYLRNEFSVEKTGVYLSDMFGMYRKIADIRFDGL